MKVPLCEDPAFCLAGLAFDRKDFGLGGSIPFVRIADRVELTVDFKATRVSGSPLLFKQ